MGRATKGKAVRWGIAMADDSMFVVAGLWRECEGGAGTASSCTQLTMNADDHPLMRRFQKPETRSARPGDGTSGGGMTGWAALIQNTRGVFYAQPLQVDHIIGEANSPTS